MVRRRWFNRGGLGVVAPCRRGTVALPGGRDLQGEGLAGPRGDAGRDGVPPQAAVHLVVMAAHVGFGSEGFEAHWAGFSSGCAESPWPTSSNNNNDYYFMFPLEKNDFNKSLFWPSGGVLINTLSYFLNHHIQSFLII